MRTARLLIILCVRCAGGAAALALTQLRAGLRGRRDCATLPPVLNQPTNPRQPSTLCLKNRSSANFATKLSVQVQLIVELNVVLDGVDRAVSAGEALVVGAEEGEEYEEWELDTATGAMTRQ